MTDTTPDPGHDLPAVVATTPALRGLLAHAQAYGQGDITPYGEDDVDTHDLLGKIVAEYRAAAVPDANAPTRISATLALLDRLDESGENYDTDLIRAYLTGESEPASERIGPPLTGRCLYCTTPVTFDAAGAWVDDTDGDGCDNPTARHTAVVGETTGPVCRYLDLSTRHLPQTVVSHLSAHDGVTAISTGTGWLVSVPEDPDAHAADYGNPDDYDGVPATLLVVQRYARSLGCDRLLFDRDAPVVADLPTFTWD